MNISQVFVWQKFLKHSYYYNFLICVYLLTVILVTNNNVYTVNTFRQQKVKLVLHFACKRVNLKLSNIFKGEYGREAFILRLSHPLAAVWKDKTEKF